MRCLYSLLFCILFLFLPLCSISARNVQNQPLDFEKQLSLSELFEKTSTYNKYLFVYVDIESNRNESPLLQLCENQPMLCEWIRTYCISYQFDAFLEIEKTQYWNIQKFPSLLLFDEKGKLLLNVHDFSDWAVVGKNFENQIPEDEVLQVRYALQMQEDAIASIQRGEEQSHAIYNVAGYEQFTVESKTGYGLLINSFQSKEALLSEYSVHRKGWRGKVVMFAETVRNKELYHLVFGEFSDKDEAITMQTQIYEGTFMRTKLVQYSELKDRFIESESPLSDEYAQ